MAAKISIIGAGSAVFSLGLVRDLCLTPTLSGSLVSLMDVNADRLQAIHTLCGRYIEETGADIRSESTSDRRESLRDADFVINTALVAGYERMYAGWRRAEQLGYRLGGSLHIMHDEPFWVNFYQLRFFEDVIQDIREVCPRAWYLQVANPVLAGVTYLERKYPDINMVGVCHGFAAVYEIADQLGLDPAGLTFEIPGVNHNVWLRSIHHDGQDVRPLLDAWIDNEAEAYWDANPKSDGLGPQAVDLYERFGVFPIGDTCTPGGGSWPWWYHTDEATENRWREDPAGWWTRHAERGEAKVRSIQQAAQDTSRPVTEAFPPEKSREVMVPFIEAVAVDLPRVLIGNILNRGNYVSGVPQDFAVEIPLHVSKHGVRGIQTAALPPAVIAHIIRDRVVPVSLELAAYDEGSRERLVELVVTDPWTRSLGQAQELVDDILSMPEHDEMRRHYCAT
jgi:alpha-galactosidase